MPKPLAICLEDLEPGPGRPRYLRCVAVVGRAPGLRVDAGGSVLWKSDEAVACEIWVSQDEKLILYRPAGGAPVTVRREGRSLEVPEAKPVVLLDQDRFEVGTRGVRVHIHGAIDHVYAPSPLPEPVPAGRARAAAAVAALGAALGAADCKKTEPVEEVEVRATPPVVPWGTDVALPSADATGLPGQDVVEASSAGPDGEPIEVRVRPPEMTKLPDKVEPPAPDAAATAEPQPDAGASSPDVASPPDAAAIEVRAMPPAVPRRIDASTSAEPVADAGREVRTRPDETSPIEVRTRPPAPPIEARQPDPTSRSQK